MRTNIRIRIAGALIVSCTLASIGPVSAQMIDAKWTVTKYAGEAWFTEPDAFVGRTQRFYKGEAEGVFYSCNYEGQSMTYHRYEMAEFLTNKEFDDFAKLGNQLGITGETVFVHRITCNGKSEKTRRVLYPFVTVEPGNKAYYLFEGAIYELERPVIPRPLPASPRHSAIPMQPLICGYQGTGAWYEGQELIPCDEDCPNKIVSSLPEPEQRRCYNYFFRLILPQYR